MPSPQLQEQSKRSRNYNHEQKCFKYLAAPTTKVTRNLTLKESGFISKTRQSWQKRTQMDKQCGDNNFVIQINSNGSKGQLVNYLQNHKRDDHDIPAPPPQQMFSALHKGNDVERKISYAICLFKSLSSIDSSSISIAKDARL